MLRLGKPTFGDKWPYSLLDSLFEFSDFTLSFEYFLFRLPLNCIAPSIRIRFILLIDAQVVRMPHNRTSFKFQNPKIVAAVS
jgi:hypothetical protein